MNPEKALRILRASRKEAVKAGDRALVDRLDMRIQEWLQS